MKDHKIRWFFFGVFFFAVSCADKRAPTLRPSGYENSNVLSIENGNLKAVFVDNAEIRPDHRAGYNGIAQLFHAGADSNVFVPAYAGFNLEHIFGGDSLHQLFEPRRHPMVLFRKTDNEVLLYQDATPISGVESLTEFRVVAPHYIDVTFTCILHDVSFFKHGYAGFFWASYIHRPPDKKIYFVQAPADGGPPSWTAAFSPVHGVSSTHRAVDDAHAFYFAPDFNASLASHFSDFRFAAPYYYGRVHDMVLAFLFRSKEVIRFSQSPTGGGADNPAWDFQYIIPDPEEGKKYSFKARVVYKPFVSDEDIASEYKSWQIK